LWELHAASIMLFMPTNITPQKKDGRYLCVEVFSQELEELHQDTFKNGENHKLGDVKTPLYYTHTLRLHTSTFCFSINAVLSHKLEVSFIVCFCFVLFLFG
jgi:hypothetical protein